MSVRHVWSGFALVCLMVLPALAVSQQPAAAAGTPKAEWRPGKASKAVPAKAKKTSPVVAPPVLPPVTPPPVEVLPAPIETPSTAVVDQSQEVLEIDFALAASIVAKGPKDGYSSALSDEGILYDANGASPVGLEAATSRFGTFPGDVLLVRTPERALAAGGSGSSWGTYSIKRGEAILSSGRYISVWRRELSGWKMISELAAGKTFAPPPPSQIGGVLPKRPVQLGRAAPAPIGVPLTVPVPPPSAPAQETPPAP